jgi:hypothetical protein
MCKEKNYVFAHMRKFKSTKIIGSAKRKSENRKNIWSANRKSAKFATFVEGRKSIKKIQ